MIDVDKREEKLIFMLVRFSAELGASVGEHAKQPNSVLLEERKHSIVKKVGRRGRRSHGVELADGDLAVRIHECLLVDASHALERT